MSNPVVIVAYDPSWPDAFASLRDRVAAALGDLPVAIEHVGSTSVPGLGAKPVIDLDVVLAATADVPEAIRRLATIGYIHQGDLGIAGREAFGAPQDTPAHHLYAVVQGIPAHRDHVLFRDYLRTHPEAVQAYDALKAANADRFRADRDAYQDAKQEFVEGIIRRAESEAGRD